MALFISLFSSCSKNEVECNSSAPVITVATSVEAGGNIELKVQSIGMEGVLIITFDSSYRRVAC